MAMHLTLGDVPAYGLKAYEGMNTPPICAAARNVVRFTFLVDRLERLPLPALCVI